LYLLSPCKTRCKKALGLFIKGQELFCLLALDLKIMLNLIFNHLHFAFQTNLPSLLDFRIYGDTHARHQLHTIRKNRI